MPYIAPEVVQEVKRMDLLAYLKNYEPYELVHFSGNTYITKSHDSLKISNGKWMWWSREIGGRSALDYLIKVRDYTFMEAVETIAGLAGVKPPVALPAKKQTEKKLLMPEPCRYQTRLVSYLRGRGIDGEIVDFCLRTGCDFLFSAGGLDILILDEPTNGLDVEGKDCLWKGLKELRDKHNMTILISSHSLGKLENNLESFFIMKDGQIISNAKREEINQYYLVRIENIQHFADAAEELTILSKNTQNQVIVKMKKEAYEDMVERNGNSFRHRSWQLIDEYYFVMHKENHT